MNTIFLLAFNLCLASYLSFFVFRFSFVFAASRYVYLRVPSSVQQPSAILSK